MVEHTTVKSSLKTILKIVSESPSKIPGVKTVEYNMPKLNMDGTPTGEYGNKVFTKTIYDPKIISDKEFINRGIEAANDAKLKTSDGVLSREWTGVDSKEITWRGYHKDGEISSFFPE
nr:CdiA family toxin C-terminal domain-containing protein [Bacillus cereus group sp. BfR-BA-01355]